MQTLGVLPTQKMNYQCAGAYIIEDRIILHSSLNSEYGWLMYGPCSEITINSPVQEIGEAVKKALSASRHESEIEESVSKEMLNRYFNAFLRVAGVTSNRKLVQSSLYCGILHREQEIIFSPTHNGGTKGSKKGHQFKGNSIKIPYQASAVEVGSALIECCSLCTSIYNT
jgi:hypothetical protein